MAGRLIITHGLPGSGKSTHAIKMVEDDITANTVRVNRDDIRDELFGEEYVKNNRLTNADENLVTDVQVDRTHEALGKGKTVICDDTNLNVRFMTAWRKMADIHSIKLEQLYFDVPVEECKRRNKIRAASGGRDVPDFVIDRMARNAYSASGRLKEFIIEADKATARDNSGRLLVEEFNEEMIVKHPLNGGTYPHGNINVVVVDLDGTLAEMRAASDLAFGPVDEFGNPKPKKKQRDFHLFHMLAENAEPNEDVLQIIKDARKNGLNVIAVSGRQDEYALQTINFLKRISAPISRLEMRRSGDYRADNEVKRDIAAKLQEEGLAIVHVIDDRPQVCALWRELGIPLTEVPWHQSQAYDATRVYPKINVPNIYKNSAKINNGTGGYFNGNNVWVNPKRTVSELISIGRCIRCGRALKSGIVGPGCFKKLNY